MSNTLDNGLRRINWYITSHDAHGQTQFQGAIPETSNGNQ